MQYQMVANKSLSPARGGDPACACHRLASVIVCPPHAGVIRMSTGRSSSAATVCPPHAGVIRHARHVRTWQRIVCPPHAGVIRTAVMTTVAVVCLPARGGDPVLGTIERRCCLSPARGGDPAHAVRVP